MGWFLCNIATGTTGPQARSLRSEEIFNGK
jgi:hypothetical protein